MSEHHLPNGKFAPGNTASTLRFSDAKIRKQKSECRAHFYEVSYKIFCRPLSELKEKLNDPDITPYEYLVAHAVHKKKFDFIGKIMDRTIGKPVNAPIEKQSGEKPIATIVKTSGERVEFRIVDDNENNNENGDNDGQPN